MPLGQIKERKNEKNNNVDFSFKPIYQLLNCKLDFEPGDKVTNPNNKDWGNYAKSMHSKGTLNGDSNGSFWYMQKSTVSAVSQGLSSDDEQNFTPKYIEVEILEKGKVALAYYYLVGSYSINGVQKNDYRTRVSQVFVKEKGKWKVKSGHFTPLHSGSGIPN